MNIKRSLLVFIVALLVFTTACTERQPSAEPEITRAAVQDIIRQAQDIQAPRGINDLKEVEIGGLKQWISVRGRDRRNPMLLFIHGGPGTTEMPVSWFYQSPLEDYFTVVQWDQRAS